MRGLSLALAIMLSCMTFFTFDAVADLYTHMIERRPYSFEHTLHLGFEILAAIGLGYGALMLWRYNLLLRKTANSHKEKIVLLRGSLEELIERRFAEWGLTAAEREVTLFILKGLATADIAAIRQTVEGTVKTQISSVFRKIGVRSRTELMSVFMDEFLDVSAHEDV
ncbi:MAG: helix-turn-helix transcriptional regulator [Rhodobacteraceae bacterium]|nr:helix-turn-helix transcriptional regulator [Paracoccaceae bacterium]